MVIHQCTSRVPAVSVREQVIGKMKQMVHQPECPHKPLFPTFDRQTQKAANGFPVDMMLVMDTDDSR